MIETSCPVCHGSRFVRDRRRLGKRCMKCGLKARTDRAADGLVIHSRDRHGIAKFARTCIKCGVTAIVGKKDARNTRCRKCVCASRATHGYTRNTGTHPLYRIIKSAEARCRYPAVKDYKWYGARGIKVCREWAADPASFVSWALANGWRRGLELDRRDNDGDYTPTNCRFVTHLENMRNRQPARKLVASHG